MTMVKNAPFGMTVFELAVGLVLFSFVCVAASSVMNLLNASQGNATFRENAEMTRQILRLTISCPATILSAPDPCPAGTSIALIGSDGNEIVSAISTRKFGSHFVRAVCSDHVNQIDIQMFSDSKYGGAQFAGSWQPLNKASFSCSPEPITSAEVLQKTFNLQFHSSGSDYFNARSARERYLVGKSYGDNYGFYFVLPNGNVYSWSAAGEMGGSRLIGKIPSSFYDDLSLLVGIH